MTTPPTTTPRTDAFHRNMTDEEEAVSWMTFCRQLERELSAANSELAAAREELKTSQEILGKLCVQYGCTVEMVPHWCEWTHRQLVGQREDNAALRAEVEKLRKSAKDVFEYESQMDELRSDKERLDWLEKQPTDSRVWVHISAFWNVRAAIDAARAANKNDAAQQNSTEGRQ